MKRDDVELFSWTTYLPPVLLIFALVVTVKLVALVYAVDPTAFIWIERWRLLALATGGVVLCVATPALLARGRRQLAALLAVDALLSLIVYIDILYSRQFEALPSFASLRYAGQLVGVRGAIASLVRPSDLWIWADVALLLALVIALPAARRLRPIPLYGACTLSALGLVLFGTTISYSPDFYRPQKSSLVLTGSLGFMGFHAYDALWAVRRAWNRRVISPEVQAAARARVDSAASEPHSATFGVARGRNVIVLQVESLQAFVLGMRTAGGAVTPNLDALARESVVFADFYHQAGVGHTSDAEFVVNCSLLPPGSIPAANEYADRVLGCLPRLLGAQGYHTHAFQTLQPDYWNAAAIERAMGFGRSHSGREFVIDEKIGMGLSDESMLRQMVAKLDSLPQPYYAFVLTLTSHSPFDYPELPPFDVGSVRGDVAGHYLRAVHYTDAAIGRFVQALRAKGVLDNAVLVIYGDHDGVTRRTAPRLAHLLGIPASDERSWFVAERRIPLLIRLPHGEHAGSVSRLGGQIDVAPTLLALLGIPRAGAAFLGRDLLAPSSTSDVAIFPTGSVLTPDRLWAAGARNRCYGPGRELPAERCSDLAALPSTEQTLSVALTDASTLAQQAHGLQAGR